MTRPDPLRANLYDFVLHSMAAMPQAPALRFGGTVLSYAQFIALVEGLRVALREFDLSPGQHVACKVGKSPEALALFFAVVAEGAVYVPVNPSFGEAETSVILDDAQPALLVLDRIGEVSQERRLAAGLFADAWGRKPMIEAPAPDEPAPAAPGGADVCATMLYTSGTTGRPKGARISHGNMAATITSINLLWEMSAKDRLLHILPTFHAHGLLMATMCPLFEGAEIMLLPKFDLDETVVRLRDATVIMAVPTIYRRLLDHPGFTREACRTIRLATCGSAPLSPELFDAVEREAGLRLVERYGSTEAGMITANPARGARRGSVGLPLPGVEFRLADSEGDRVPSGEVGRIQTRGPHLFLGYWRREDLASQNMARGGWFDTGDFGRQDEDGYLYVVGRDKDTIVSGGYNVYPREVEIALEELPGISEAVVFGVPHPEFGEGVVAAVRPAAAATVSEQIVLSGLVGRLAGYKRPKRIFVVEEFPRNELGKIIRSELGQQYAGAFSGGVAAGEGAR